MIEYNLPDGHFQSEACLLIQLSFVVVIRLQLGTDKVMVERRNSWRRTRR